METRRGKIGESANPSQQHRATPTFQHTSTSYLLSDEDECCPYCHVSVINDVPFIRCDICDHGFHQNCTGISDEAFTVLLSIAKETGWCCRKCRSDKRDCIGRLQSAVAKSNEELAEMRRMVTQMFSEINQMKENFNTHHQGPLTTNDDTTAVKTVHSVLVHRDPASLDETDKDFPSLQEAATVRESNRKSVSGSDIRRIIHDTVSDINRRACNVIVSGIAEDSTMDDAKLFLNVCESISCKPVVVSSRRIGMKTSAKPRRLLVKLRNESVAQELLKSARNLRKSEDPAIAEHVFINRDLSPEAAKMAFEERQRRRQRKAVGSVTAPANIEQSLANGQTGLNSTEMQFNPSQLSGNDQAGQLPPNIGDNGIPNYSQGRINA